MEDCFTPKAVRRRSENPNNKVEPIPVSIPLKDQIRKLKNQGLPVNEMTRTYFEMIVEKAKNGDYEKFGVKLPGKAS